MYCGLKTLRNPPLHAYLVLVFQPFTNLEKKIPTQMIIISTPKSKSPNPISNGESSHTHTNCRASKLNKRGRGLHWLNSLTSWNRGWLLFWGQGATCTCFHVHAGAGEDLHAAHDITRHTYINSPYINSSNNNTPDIPVLERRFG